MTLQQCRYLVEIAKHRSMSQAAEALYVTQPSLSKAIKELEESLAITILERTNKGVSFTKDGEELLFYAQILLDQVASMEYHFQKRQQEMQRKITISSQHYGFAVEAFVKLTKHLGERHYQLGLREGRSTKVIEDVFSGKSIIGVLAIHEKNRENFERYFAQKSLVFQALYSMKSCVFLNREHPLAKEKSLSIAQLAQYPYLTYQENDLPLYFAEKYSDPDNTSQIIYIEDRGTMNNLLSHTNGYNIGTSCIIEGYMDSNIIALPLQEHQEMKIGYIQQYGHSLPSEIYQYLDYLTDSLKHSAPL